MNSQLSLLDEIAARTPVSPVQRIASTGDQSSSPQCKRLLEWLQTGSKIDPLTAWSRFGIYRLSARIFDLREAGYNIRSTRRTVRNKYGEDISIAEYRLEERK